MNTQTFSHFANLIKSFIRFYNDLYSASAHNILEHVFQKGPSKACVDYKTLNLSEDLKEYIVSIHNDIRNHVASGQETKGGLGRQPSAANMNMLEWDDELAAVAQRWADQCIPINETIQHDICKRSKRFEVGQNVITAVTADQDFPELAALILHWYKQVGNVIPSDIDHFSGIKRGQFMIGQYTQLVWAKTRYIGCGISIFLDIQSSTPKKKFYNHRLVCNYGPAGNILGHTVYQKGIPCSKCAWGQCDIFRTSLCTSKDDRKKIQNNKRTLSQPCFNMIQGQNSTETIYLSPSDALSNVHIAIKNNKRHVVFSKNRDVKHGRVRVKKNVNLTDLSQEYRRSSVNVVDLLDTTKSPISDINGKIFGMSEEGGRMKGGSLVSLTYF
ncbi:unnamed protein product [Acanthoscelides obtectus]|uniref:SCP domain-containing protein n=1 Tax=Acanthoscelides obtectus TaxID=200917 RepID=A0A9P0K3L6_ACAOB|nr:unnamed protein product [Acanthoscelides obtectus]CAK1629736.1 hypothetical protein AOBTE_LOCUS5918 [Acanthoscelides obtectus]